MWIVLRGQDENNMTHEKHIRKVSRAYKNLFADLICFQNKIDVE